MARIPHRSTHTRRTTRNSERAQLIHDTETDTYLNYRQLLKHPKYKETWAKSAANEFGRLTQGLKDGRVKGTNTIKYIRKDQVPIERRKDVTYGASAASSNQTKKRKNAPDLPQEETASIIQTIVAHQLQT
jgi:hypothetical protein